MASHLPVIMRDGFASHAYDEDHVEEVFLVNPTGYLEPLSA